MRERSGIVKQTGAFVPETQLECLRERASSLIDRSTPTHSDDVLYKGKLGICYRTFVRSVLAGSRQH